MPRQRHIRMPDDLYDKITEVAERERRSVAEVVREALRVYLVYVEMK